MIVVYFCPDHVTVLPLPLVPHVKVLDSRELHEERGEPGPLCAVPKGDRNAVGGGSAVQGH